MEKENWWEQLLNSTQAKVIIWLMSLFHELNCHRVFGQIHQQIISWHLWKSPPLASKLWKLSMSSTSFANILHYMVSMYFFFFFGVLNHTGLYLLGTRVILLLLLVIPHSHNFRGNCRNKLHPSARMAFVLFS